MTLIKSVSGIRGIVRSDNPREITMTDALVRRVGLAYGTYLLRLAPEGASAKAPLLVGGRDGRPGGDTLLKAFCEGARSAGLRTVNLGVATTPTVGLGVKDYGALGGVVITASHNPIKWNGVKLMTSRGQAPSKSAAEAIFAILDQSAPEVHNVVDDDDSGDIDIHGRHVDAVLAILDVAAIRSRRFKVALDSANGAGGRVGRMLLERLGCDVVHQNADNGVDFAHTPEPVAENLTGLCDAVTAASADVGFAQDPDADRLAMVDEAGRFIGEEYTLALCATRVFSQRAGVAATNLSTSRMIEDVAERAGSGRRVVRSAVGEANVVEAMLSHDCILGGEGNGGVIDPRVVYVRDSLVAMGLTLDLLAASGKRLSDHVAESPRYAMLKEKITCDRDQIETALGAFKAAFADQRIDDSDGVRVDWPTERKWAHVRGSNTEPIMRLIVEAPTDSDARRLMDRVRGAIGSSASV